MDNNFVSVDMMRGDFFMFSYARMKLCEDDGTKSLLDSLESFEEFCKVDSSFNLETVLALIVMLYWMKCILLLRVTKTFGPMLKII